MERRRPTSRQDDRRGRDAGRRRRRAPTRRAATAGRPPVGRRADPPRRRRPTGIPPRRPASRQGSVGRRRRSGPPGEAPAARPLATAHDPKGVQGARPAPAGAAHDPSRTRRLTIAFSAGQPRTPADRHARRDARRARRRPRQGRPAADVRGRRAAQRRRPAVDARSPLPRPAGLDLRPQRRGAGAVGPRQHDRRQPQAGRRPDGTAETFARVLGLDDDRRDELAAAMAAEDRGFVYVARQVDAELADQIACARTWRRRRSTGRTAACSRAATRRAA